MWKGLDIEVLGRGNQAMAFGIHPKTGQPYTWERESPAETPVESLPLVPPEQVEATARAAFEMVPPDLRPRGWQMANPALTRRPARARSPPRRPSSRRWRTFRTMIATGTHGSAS